jgi:hypothetical protein
MKVARTVRGRGGRKSTSNGNSLAPYSTGSANTNYRYLHLSPEELTQLPPDELLQSTLEMRRLLSIVMGVLYTPDSTLILRAVTIDLLHTEAERLSRQQGSGDDVPVTYNIKTVSERLGIRPTSVR